MLSLINFGSIEKVWVEMRKVDERLILEEQIELYRNITIYVNASNIQLVK